MTRHTVLDSIPIERLIGAESVYFDAAYARLHGNELQELRGGPSPRREVVQQRLFRARARIHSSTDESLAPDSEGERPITGPDTSFPGAIPYAF